MGTSTFPSCFSSSYMCVRSLHCTLKNDPAQTRTEVIEILENILLDKTHARQTCAQFLYQQAAETLHEIVLHTPDPDLSLKAYRVLHRFALRSVGDPCLASAQALGRMPLKISTPTEDAANPDFKIKTSSWQDLLKSACIHPFAMQWFGRSLVLRDQKKPAVLVLKMANGSSQESGLKNEAFWMNYLQNKLNFTDRFDLPQPVFQQNPLIKLDEENLPGQLKTCAGKNSLFLPYITHPDYFIYPNHTESSSRLNPDRFLATMFRNSKLLGQLNARGIVHTAPIALFHNRTQQSRREDQGQYLWMRRGRLDRWLDSCYYPNFGLSGLRDFEHFCPYRHSQRELFRQMGNQILSLTLVAGSYFRCREPQNRGWDEKGKPVDVRHLFDLTLLKQALKGIFHNYFLGFVGKRFPLDQGPSTEQLAKRMIEEMGIDRYMTEILRIEDQLSMNHQQFVSFLKQRGIDEDQAAKFKQGREEITLHTGPHLGQFNGTISLPEVIDFTAGATATCMGEKFLQDSIAD